MFSWLSRKREGECPEWLQSYLALSFKTKGKSLIEDEVFIVLDCETSGLKMSDKIITIGALRCTAKELFINDVLDQKYPEIEVGKSAEIHGELSSGVTENVRDLLQELVGYVGNSVIVGHNISFDIHMINNLLNQTYGVKLKNKVLDTAKLVMRLDPVFFERTVGGKSMLHLDDLCNKYEIEIANRHTALGDAYLTAQLLQRLLTLLKKRGVASIGHLL